RLLARHLEDELLALVRPERDGLFALELAAAGKCLVLLLDGLLRGGVPQARLVQIGVDDAIGHTVRLDLEGHVAQAAAGPRRALRRRREAGTELGLGVLE